jgi:hypothetical protein
LEFLLDIQRLYQDYNIPYSTDGHKHCRPGWINIECPFCVGNSGVHLGATLDGQRFHCWRCGGKHSIKALCKILNTSYEQVKILIREYGGVKKKSKVATTSATILKKRPFKFPTGACNLGKQHIQYLKNRKFNATKLERIWELTGTGPIALLEKINYKHRIIAPIYWNGEIVSFQSRDVTNKSDLRYMACPQIRERIDHQNILYGRQSDWGPFGICVEGITDVWRFGPIAFSVFGIDYTSNQLREIVNHFKGVAVVFDDDPQAVKQADILIGELKFRGVHAWSVQIEGDPGSMSQYEANELVQRLTRQWELIYETNDVPSAIT